MNFRTSADLEMGRHDDEVAATVALIRSKVVSAPHLGSLIDEFGSAVRLVQLSETDRLFVTPNASHALVGAVSADDLRRALVLVDEWNRMNVDVRSVLDQTYPDELREIFDRPPLVFVSGQWKPWQSSPCIAVVGTRSASHAGLRRARAIATELVGAGCTVLSGLAAGIDTEAHTAALDAGGKTSAVMGTGLGRVFPSENAPLAKRILDNGGALISQFFPAQPPARWTFPMRNVVMSGLAMATVVIEAGETSGARMQARVALHHGRTVFLLRSLVEQHEWARKFVQDGAHGSFAVMFEHASEIIDRIAPASSSEQLAVA